METILHDVTLLASLSLAELRSLYRWVLQDDPGAESEQTRLLAREIEDRVRHYGELDAIMEQIVAGTPVEDR